MDTQVTITPNFPRDSLFSGESVWMYAMHSFQNVVDCDEEKFGGLITCIVNSSPLMFAPTNTQHFFYVVANIPLRYEPLPMLARMKTKIKLI